MATVSTDVRQGVNAGMAVKVPCKAASDANLTLSAEQTIDGVACVTGDRVLVKNQTDGAANGIYVVDTGDWARSQDWNGVFDATQGTLIYVHSGSSNKGFWTLATSGTITIGTTSVSFDRDGLLGVVADALRVLVSDASGGITTDAGLTWDGSVLAVTGQISLGGAAAGGVVTSSYSLGTIASGTVTPDPQDSMVQHYANNGAHALAPSNNIGSIILDITNGAAAGVITTSGFTQVIGDNFDTVNGNKFRCSITIGNGGSLLNIVALQ